MKKRIRRLLCLLPAGIISGTLLGACSSFHPDAVPVIEAPVYPQTLEQTFADGGSRLYSAVMGYLTPLASIFGGIATALAMLSVIYCGYMLIIYGNDAQVRSQTLRWLLQTAVGVAVLYGLLASGGVIRELIASFF